MSKELKPCPFCGGTAVIHVNDGVRVICTVCGATTQPLVDTHAQGKPTGGAVGKVIELWNRRVIEVVNGGGVDA